MKNYVWESDTTFDVSYKYDSIEFYVPDPLSLNTGQEDVIVVMNEDRATQRVVFTLDPSSATRLKEFLTKKGY